MESIIRFLRWLNDPILVVHWQRLMGVERDGHHRAAKEIEGERSECNGSNGLILPPLSRRKLSRHNNNNYNSLPIRREMSPDTSDCPSDTAEGQTTDTYTIHHKSLYYLYMFGSGLGNEMFYASFFPFWLWNVDGSVGRRVVMVWAFVMYLGQAAKDIICLPRPASPPVVRLEGRYALEYGLPSTHAMVGVSIPFSLLLFTMYRYEYDFWYAAVAAFIWCALVCLSRIYMGMHSVLDVLAGLLFAILLMILFLPWVDTIDYYQLHNTYSPLLTVSIPLLMAVFYPTPDVWSTARGDTTTILGSCAGVSLGSWLNYQLGLITEGEQSGPPYSIIWPTFHDHGLMLLRASIGIMILVATRAILKTLTHAVVAHVFHIDRRDKSQHKRLVVELPIKFLTYMGMAINVVYLSPRVFHILSIDRATWYTEV